MQRKNIFMLLVLGAIAAGQSTGADACTGISLKSKDNAEIVARSIEWAGDELDSEYVVVPRGYKQQSLLPNGGTDGMPFTAQYGYVGLAVEQPQFIMEGLNEAGLSAGLFYFPNFGEYPKYDPADKDRTVADFQLVAWMLSQFATIDQVKQAVPNIRVVGIDPRASTVHWRIADASGQQVILEFVDGVPHFYDNPVGVLTNSPGFEWHLTNLDNYVNLHSGGANPMEVLGELQLEPLGKGSGLLGLPGDATPPSRFVRAAFYRNNAVTRDNAYDTMVEAFHILNSFEIPTGIQYPKGKVAFPIPSATQWTVVTDMTNRIVYYKTMFNNTIREINLADIDFATVQYQYHPLDAIKRQPVTTIKIN